jgi:predicted  nucleic acid-binding Zn-ribbon protein
LDPKPDTIINHSRQLERELNAANERIKNLESALCTVENIDKVNAYQDLKSANDRIKRLEEAGDEAIYPFEYAARVRIWTEAKEAKL